MMNPDADPSGFHCNNTPNADPANTFVVEDSVHGIHGAKAAGMRVIGFTGGSHSYPGHADILTEALVTGRTHRAKRQGECDIWVAVQVVAEDGQLLEVMGLVAQVLCWLCALITVFIQYAAIAAGERPDRRR